ncbi:MAG: BatA domain-containing protein, partial [Acidobacteriaceae bacterium]|nr:BatA domain-containing protein [Acidobacteriaceae bacterium]
MGFFSPWFLAGVAAAGFPLWLHLLRQYKRTPQPFSSLMFFERRVQSSVKHRRLRYWVLLALRIGLLVLLALAFANPFVNRKAALASRSRLNVIAIDRSFSMRYGNRIEEAKRWAHRVVSGLGARDLVQIIAVDSGVENLTQPESDRRVLNAAIDSIQARDEASSFGELTRALRMMDQTTGMELAVRFASDMQQTSMPPNFRDLQLGPHIALQIERIGDGGANWTVDSVSTSAHVYDANHTRLTATIAGYETQAAQRKVALMLDGKVLASKDVNVPPNGRASVEFLRFDVPYGSHRGQIRIEPHDQLPHDDQFYFAIERSDPRRILYLYAGGRAKEAFYYKAAIESAADIGLTVEAQPAEFASNVDFSKYAFVVLNDIAEPGEKLTRALSAYVSRGGAALVTAGPDIARYGRLPLTNEAVSEVRAIEGARLVDSQHPAVAGAGHFENVQFFQTARFLPKANARVIARLADGGPLLVEESMGEGRLLIFASTLDNSTNDFPLHASFVPFVVQTGHYLTGNEDMPSNVVVGTPVVLRHTRDQGTAADV